MSDARRPARPDADVDPRLLEILVCPVTHGPLDYDRAQGELISRGAKPRLSDPRRRADHAARGGARAGRGRVDLLRAWLAARRSGRRSR